MNGIRQIRRFKLFVSLLSLSMSLCLKAQHIYTIPYALSGVVNSPAQTGLFAGSYRVEGLYFSQLQTQDIKGIQSVLLNIDAPLSSFVAKDWTGLGVNIARDVSGFAGFATTELGLSAAYHMSLGKAHKTVVSAGGQVNYIQRNIDPSNLVFQNDLLKNNPGLDLQRLNFRNQNYVDANVGINVRLSPKPATTYQIGANVEHLFTPNNSFSVERIAKLARNFVFLGSMETYFGRHYLLNTNIHVKKLPYTTEITANATGGMRINEDKNIVFRTGLGYRDTERGQILLGLDYNRLRFGFMYETSIGASTSKNVPNFMALTASYIGLIYRRPKAQTAILCPKY